MALLRKGEKQVGSLGPVEAFMLAISNAPRAGARLQAARLHRSFAERLACTQVRDTGVYVSKIGAVLGFEIKFKCA